MKKYESDNKAVGDPQYAIGNWEYFSELLKKNCKIYPIISPTGDTYGENKMVNGRKKKVTLPYLCVEANLDGNIITFNKEQFKQDEVHFVINKLLEYYATRELN